MYTVFHRYAVVHCAPVRVAIEPAARHPLDASLWRVPLLHGPRRARRLRQHEQRLVPVSSDELRVRTSVCATEMLHNSEPERDSTRESPESAHDT